MSTNVPALVEVVIQSTVSVKLAASRDGKEQSVTKVLVYFLNFFLFIVCHKGCDEGYFGTEFNHVGIVKTQLIVTM